MKKSLLLNLLCLIALVLLTVSSCKSGSVKKELTRSELETYGVYKIETEAIPHSIGEPEKDRILSLCEFSETVTEGDVSSELYTSEKLGGYIGDFSSFRFIELHESYLYIGYDTTGGESVTLCYDDSGFVNMAVYNSETDIIAYVEPDSGYTQTHFRNTPEEIKALLEQ